MESQNGRIEQDGKQEVLRIAICCMGGFSSSTMAAHLNGQVAAKHLEDKVFLEYVPFFSLIENGVGTGKTNRQEEVDVALLCPHLEFDAQRADKAGQLSIPVFVLPMRLYGQANIEDLIEDAEDVLELWKPGDSYVVQFPDEPRSMVATRAVSHRKWVSSQR